MLLRSAAASARRRDEVQDVVWTYLYVCVRVYGVLKQSALIDDYEKLFLYGLERAAEQQSRHRMKERKPRTFCPFSVDLTWTFCHGYNKYQTQKHLACNVVNLGLGLELGLKRVTRTPFEWSLN